MGITFTLYNKFTEYLGGGVINLKSDTIKLMLVTGDYTPDVTHDVLADVKASPDPEVVAIASPDNGYPAGGKTLSGLTYVSADSPAQSKFDADDLSFLLLSATFRYGILYALGTLGGVVDPLIGYITFSTTPGSEDIVVNGLDYVVQWSAFGILTVAPSA